MERKFLLSSRLSEVLLTGRWIANTNYAEQITDTTWSEAIQQVGSLNTIAALTFHINYYLSGLLDAFASGKLEISDKYSFDLLPLQNEADWNDLVAEFLDNSTRFVEFVQQMPEQLLDEPFIDARYGSYLRNIEGVIEHSYYHLGQISIIKKMIREAYLS